MRKVDFINRVHSAFPRPLRPRFARPPKPSQSPPVTALPKGEPRRESQGGRAKEGEPRRESQEGRAKGILPLPLGEVAERSEDGEGKDGA